MGLFEYYCPITGEKVRVRALAGEDHLPHYSAGASKEAIDKWEADQLAYLNRLSPGRPVTLADFPVQWQRHQHQK